MGIYLPNMEMPKSCYECPLQDDECFGSIKCRYAKTWGSEEMRAVDCPLVLVPPHGDLIDAEEEMRLMQSCDYDTYDDYSRAFDMLDNAPTIIPAEEGER